MRKIVLFAAAVAVFVLIGIDAWLCIRTLSSGALAGSTFNPLTIATRAQRSPISQDFLLVSPE
jgi:hypothetical protein